MRNIQQLFVALIVTLLAACGGGGTLDSGGGNGGGNGGGTTPVYSLNVSVVDAQGEELREVSQDQPGEIRATLLRDNQPAANQLIRFELDGNVGVLSPAEGTARTDENGVAKVVLLAGEIPGAGAVTASYTATSGVISSEPFVFDSLGDLSNSVSLSVRVLNEADEEVRTLAHATPRKLEAQLTIDGQPAAFKIVRFVAEFSGVINPASGLAMTNEQGIAVVDILAGTTAGAGQVYAEYTSSNNIVTKSASFSYTSAGDAPVQGDNSGYIVTMTLVNSDSLEATNNIDAANAAYVRARVTTLQNMPVANQVVSFTSTLGRFRPNLGTALTNADGLAQILLTAGTVEGAGTATAQFQSTSNSVGFYTKGDEIDSSEINADVSFRLLTECSAEFRTNRNPALCTESTSISAENPGVLFVKVVREGSTTPLNQVLVSAQTTLGNISPSTGTAITDGDGVALLDLLAGRDVGAGEINVSALNATATKAFEIGAAQVSITVDSGLAAGTSLAAGSTTQVSVEIRNSDNDLYTPPLDIEFTSNCVQAGQAVIDAQVTSVGGIARATYRADGCVGNDTVTATVITGGDSVTGSVVIPVSAANIGALEFVSASTDYLALKGTGGANRVETAVVSFRLKDENGANAAGRAINFTLSTEVGGLSLEPSTALTNNDGIVQTVIRSGTVPTPVRVIAIFNDGTQVIQAPSDNLNVSTGVADQNSFSLALSSLNVHALDFDGTEVPVTVFLADHFNNPVPDGTAVSFVTEGGAIEPRCLTENGRCSVNWRSQNPRPYTGEKTGNGTDYKNTIFDKCHDGKPCPMGIVNVVSSSPLQLEIDHPLGGRSGIMAYAIGEESFSDRNGNGRFDITDYVSAYDIGEAYINHNENLTYDGVDCSDASDPCEPLNSDGGEFEEFIDFNSDGIRNAANGLYNGLLCTEEQAAAGVCSRELLNVFRNSLIVMSGDEAYFRLTTTASDCSTIAGVSASVVRYNSSDADEISGLCNVSAVDLSDTPAGASSVQLSVYISDLYNNPMPVGTTVDIAADNGVVSGNNSYTFPNTTSRIPVSVPFTLTREPVTGGNERFDGALTITVTAPNGLVSSMSIPVKDDR